MTKILKKLFLLPTIMLMTMMLLSALLLLTALRRGMLEKLFLHAGDNNGDDGDVVISVATLKATDAEEVGETVSAADDVSDDEDVDNNFAGDGTFDDTSDDDDPDRDFKKQTSSKVNYVKQTRSKRINILKHNLLEKVDISCSGQVTQKACKV